MKTPILLALMAIMAAYPTLATTNETNSLGSRIPIGWLDLHAGPRDASIPGHDLQKSTRRLFQGALLPVFKTREKHKQEFAQVGLLNLNTGNAELGWVEMNPAELKAPESYPTDSELLRLLGGAYLEDFTADHTHIARFLMLQGQSRPALLCYLVTPLQMMAKLVVFMPSEKTYRPGAALDITISDLHAGVTSFEIRDLLSDGSDCVITQEPFREQMQTFGSNLYIRNVADGQFQTLWQAPVEFRNLSEYNPKMQILQPPEQNIGAPGTMTTAEVTFRPNGKGQEPVWRGKVDFFVTGREKPVDFVKIEKACPWNGRVFAPLR